MNQSCRDGEAENPPERRGAGRRGAVAVGLLLFLIAACAPSTGGSNPAPSGRFAFDPAGALFASSYRQIRDYYLDPVSVESLALAGIGTLDAGSAGAGIDLADHAVRLLDHGTEIARLPRPDPLDAEGWAEVTSAALSAARTHDPALAAATDEELYRRVFEGVTGKLDRFSRYAGAEAARDQKASRDGFGGIGVTLDYTETEPRITSVTPDGPAARAGVRIDDRIVIIDGVPTVGLDERQVTAKLRGRPESRVFLALDRRSRPRRDGLIPMTLTRSLIVPVSVTAERDDGIAIFRVANFNHDTAKSLAQQFERMRAEMGPSMTGIVLDLRSNPGGLLDQAVDVAGMFLDRGEIVAAAGRHPTSNQDFEAGGKDQTNGLPMVVLVDGGSASSAEIVAAALQDDGRAVVVGSSSYGKGTVQMVITLENTGELTLTWARLVTPSGYILHHHGVVPAFCTSEPIDPVAPAEDGSARLARILEQGLHPVPGIATKPRSSLTEAGWEDLRKSCPSETRDSALDLVVAERLLQDRTLYAQALTLPGIAVAHDPDSRPVHSALQ
jgi:carboxyl-terminal processing protease